jgi:hypothetical protein
MAIADEDPDNIYLREYLDDSRPTGEYHAWLRDQGRVSGYERRRAAVRRYAFGIPNKAALDAIARHAPIVELGAGTGYWAYLLQRRGVDIVAFDIAPPGELPNAYRFDPLTWTEVKKGGVEVLDQYPDRALFLCWPGYKDTFADEALSRYAGKVLIYVGEAEGGRTANPAFFARLGQDWTKTKHVSIPQWPGAQDRLNIYYRQQAL